MTTTAAVAAVHHTQCVRRRMYVRAPPRFFSPSFLPRDEQRILRSPMRDNAMRKVYFIRANQTQNLEGKCATHDDSRDSGRFAPLDRLPAALVHSFPPCSQRVSRRCLWDATASLMSSAKLQYLLPRELLNCKDGQGARRRFEKDGRSRARNVGDTIGLATK